MIRQAVIANELPPPIGPFSHAVRARSFVFLSGQVGVDPSTGALVEGDAARQTEQALTNLSAVLRAAGKSLADVVKTTVFLVDMGDFAAMNSVYARHFSTPHPARTTVAVAALPLGAAVEIEAVAG